MRIWNHAARRLTRPATFAICLLLFSILAASPAIAKKKGTSSRKKQAAPEKGVLLVPPEYPKERSYPVLVAMPYTGGTPENFFGVLALCRVPATAIHDPEVGQYPEKREPRTSAPPPRKAKAKRPPPNAWNWPG